jgi:hypothetical protein
MMTQSPSNIALRAVLALAGVAIIFLGLNVGLGGIRTLGWQGSTGFLTVTDAPRFDVQDSHVRFLGGLFGGLGLIMLMGAVYLARMRAILMALSAVIFVGGLARLSVVDANLLTGAEILPSIALELIGFPALGLWIMRATQSNAVP